MVKVLLSSRPGCRGSLSAREIRRYIIISWYVVTRKLTPLSLCDRYTYTLLPSPFPLPILRATMTDAHERITLPPISSFDISPSHKPHSQFQVGPSRRGPHLHGSPSWDGSSAGSNHLRSELDDISYGCGTFYSFMFRVAHIHRCLDPAQVDTMLSTALIVTATLRLDKHAVITRHTQSRPSWLPHMSQPPPLLAHAAAALLLIEGVPSFSKYHVLAYIASRSRLT